ncbi:uncharacterized protein [Temnothorax longispinosus]|uniref:uncharacterized protein n=1 Tax=Temnothorax longispinosus TaxID=300112 RepID=UPI003A995FE8
MKRTESSVESTDLPSGSKNIGKQTENFNSLKDEVAKLEEQVRMLQLENNDLRKHVKSSKKPDHVVYGQKLLPRTPQATAIFKSPVGIVGKSGCGCKGNCSSRICGCVKNSNKCGLSCKCDDEICQNQEYYHSNATAIKRPVEKSGCDCKGDCSSRMCGCVKKNNRCGPSCKCDEEICEN